MKHRSMQHKTSPNTAHAFISKLFLFPTLLYFLNKQTCTIKKEIGERSEEIFGNSQAIAAGSPNSENSSYTINK